MADINFKKISDESFESVSVYLDYILRITSEIGEPAFIDYNGTRFFFTRVRNDDGYLYACSYRKEDGIRLFGLVVPNKNPECVKITDGVTIYRDYSSLKEHPYVLKENVLNNNTEQVVLGPDPNGQECMVYYQNNKENNMDCEIVYSLKGFENRLFSYLSYIDTKYPKSIEIGENKKIFRVINHRSFEKYRYNESQYLVPAFCIFGYEFANANRVYDFDEVMYNVRMNGFNSCIPSTLSSILTHTNEVEKNMKVLAKVYDENIMKLG